jgi:hypothetical protein
MGKGKSVLVSKMVSCGVGKENRRQRCAVRAERWVIGMRAEATSPRQGGGQREKPVFGQGTKSNRRSSRRRTGILMIPGESLHRIGIGRFVDPAMGKERFIGHTSVGRK